MMAQQALGAGRTVPRRRVMFGLLDADGWGWASVKAFVWLILITFILAYIPDRAYYFTVNRTIDLGILAWSPVNLCPPANESLPCPAPVGAVGTWHRSPDELKLPAPRTDGTAAQLGTKLLYVGGSDGEQAQSTVFVADASGVGNHDKWTEGPALPEPRSDASVIYQGGSLYVFGGVGADGQPTTTAFALTPDAQTGALGEWKPAPEALTLPEARSGASVVPVADGLLLVGGSDATGPVATTWKSKLDTKGKFGKWEPQANLYAPQTDATAALVGDFVWLFGGRDANGPVATVQRGEFGAKAAPGLAANPDEGKLARWGVSPSADLPVARTNAIGWAANGALYLAGGDDGKGVPQRGLFWAIPDAKGDLTEWKHLDSSDLPGEGLEGAAPLLTGPNVILTGGRDATGVLGSSQRANTAPQAPFFQLGLVGATVPALRIEGEIGQQLGYLNAAGVGTVNFILLLLVGWAFAHKEQTRALIGRIVRRRRHH
jgi:N-acetylneuraminic acid mutarotase